MTPSANILTMPESDRGVVAQALPCLDHAIGVGFGRRGVGREAPDRRGRSGSPSRRAASNEAISSMLPPAFWTLVTPNWLAWADRRLERGPRVVASVGFGSTGSTRSAADSFR